MIGGMSMNIVNGVLGVSVGIAVFSVCAVCVAAHWLRVAVDESVAHYCALLRVSVAVCALSGS